MADGSWIKERWLECLCIGTTIVFSMAGWLGVCALGRFIAQNYFANMGASLPGSTQYVVDLAYEPLTVNSLPVLVPTACALLGAWIKQRSWPLAGTSMLVLAPPLALIEVLLAVAALALPFLSIHYGGR